MLLYVIQWLCLLGVAALAIGKGGAPEKLGASWMVLNAGLVAAADFLAPHESKAVVYLILDAICATGFLVIALKYLSRWLGVAMLLSALIFSMQAYYMLFNRKPDWAYHATNNVVTGMVLLSLLIATLFAWRGQRTVGRRAL